MQIKKNKRIVVFEISDDHESRKHEYGKYIGGNYKKPFADFIESLGFEVVLQDHIDAIEINGERFDLYLGNASYMSKNAWNREVDVRKPINRYVSIMKGYESTMLKVHFNKEYDGDKLCKTINDAIQSRIDAKKFHEDTKNQDKINTIAVAEHFMLSDDFKNIVQSIRIHKGEIQFNLDGASLTIKPNKQFVNFHVNSSEAVLNEAELNSLFDKLFSLKEKANSLLQMVKQNEFTNEIIQWCQTAYNRHYDIKELKYSDY